MSKELNTLAPKKYLANYAGTTPTLDSTDGILIGDYAIDSSTTPYTVWQCLDNAEGAPVYIKANNPLESLFIDTKFTTGILNIHESPTAQRVNTTLAFADDTQIFTLAPSGGLYTSFDVYLSGIKTTFSTPQQIDLNDIGLVTDTLYFIYFYDVNGVATLDCAITPWEINSNAAPIATVFWNGTKGDVGDERHDATRNLVNHKWAHQNIGCRWTSGFEGTFNIDGTFSIAAGRLADEEIVLVSSAPVTSARVWYTTTGPKPTFLNDATTKSAYISGTDLQYNRTSDYTLQNVQSGYFVRNYIYGNNDTELPLALIVGQNEYNNLSDARTDAFPIAPTYINNEVKLLFTTIWTNVEGTATFVESTDYRTAPTQANGALAIRPIFLHELEDVTAPTPTLGQVLTFNGVAWVNGPPATSSAGTGIEFFNASPTITATGNDNATAILTLSKTPVTTAEQTAEATAANNTVLGAAWLYDTALGRTSIDAGTWSFTAYAYVNSVGGGRQTYMQRGVYSVLPRDGGTINVTITGTGTSRTATASGGTPFATTKIDASATNTAASYVQTPKGIYQITARASDTEVTITTPTTYTNESGVIFNVWKRLFISSSPIITATSLATTQTATWTSTQGAFTITALHKLGAITFVTSNNTTTLTTTYDGTARNTHFNTPLITLHNNLAGVQGGDANNQWHLTSLSTPTSGLTMATAKVLGRSTASTGAVEEITVGDGLSLSGGSLTTNPGVQISTVITESANLSLAHVAKGMLEVDSSSAVTVTIKPQSNTVYLANSGLAILNLNSGIVSITADSGVTLNGTEASTVTVAAGEMAYLRRTGSDTWVVPSNKLSGDFLVMQVFS
jgi:hypothetical protein